MQNLHLLAVPSNPTRKGKGSIWEIAYKRVTTLTGAQLIVPLHIEPPPIDCSGKHSNDFPCPGCHWANHCDKCYEFADCSKCHNEIDCAKCHGVEECQSAHSCVKCYFSLDCGSCHSWADCPEGHWKRDCPTCHTVEYKYCPNEVYPEFPKANN